MIWQLLKRKEEVGQKVKGADGMYLMYKARAVRRDKETERRDGDILWYLRPNSPRSAQGRNAT